MCWIQKWGNGGPRKSFHLMTSSCNISTRANPAHRICSCWCYRQVLLDVCGDCTNFKLKLMAVTRWIGILFEVFYLSKHWLVCIWYCGGDNDWKITLFYVFSLMWIRDKNALFGLTNYDGIYGKSMSNIVHIMLLNWFYMKFLLATK